MTQAAAAVTTTTYPTPWLMTDDPRALRARLAVFWVSSVLVNFAAVLAAHLLGY